MNINDILDAYAFGLDEGFELGVPWQDTSDWEPEVILAYNRGFDHGVRLYCENGPDVAEKQQATETT